MKFKLLRLTLITLTIIVGAMALPRAYANAAYNPKIFSPKDSPSAPVAIVFGAGLNRNGTASLVLRDRVDTAIQLYKTGKAQKLLFSGDNTSLNYNEPQAMKDYAISKGMSANDITLDYAGRRTYDTCLRAKEIFGVSKAILVTQNYHLDRALLTCDGLGLNVQGVSADLNPYPQTALRFWWLREFPATTQALWDLYIIAPDDVVLGKKESIFQ
jgi:vancomycin permeability regulator SanA